MEHALRAGADLAQVVVVADTGDDDVGALGGLTGRGRRLTAVRLHPGGGFGGGAVVDGDAVSRLVEIDGSTYNITCVSMGNPHCVVFCDYPDLMEIGKIGPAIETAPIFPDRVNVEFVQVLDGHTLKMRVWERGSGETLACGTGACAAVVAATENGFCKKGEDITVRLRGGDLLVRYTDETVFMTGDAKKNFEGFVEL